jgi:hypothetical protein
VYGACCGQFLPQLAQGVSLPVRDEEDTRVWYKLNDKPGFMQYLKTLLGMRLAGDFSQ